MTERDLDQSSHEQGRLTDFIYRLKEEELYELVNIVNENLLREEERITRPEFDSKTKVLGITLREWANPILSNDVRALHKIHFIADKRGDIAFANDIFGNPLYTKSHADDLIKPVEIQEALSSLYKFTEYVKSEAKKREISPHAVPLEDFLDSNRLPDPLSEISDVAYNLINAHHLDPRDEYMKIIADIGQTLGYSISDIFLLIIAKYYHRYIENKGEKDVEKEDMFIGQLLKEKILPIPSLKQLKSVYRTIYLARKPLEEFIDRLSEEVNSSAQRLRT